MTSTSAARRHQAAYFTFTADGSGRRCGYIFFDLKDPSQMPVIGEPLFHKLNASVELTPAMNAEDLRQGIEGWASDQG